MTKKKAGFTVSDLIEQLDKVDGDLPVGVIGHYGEFHAMSLYDFRVTAARTSDGRKQFVYAISQRDIGDEPE